MTMRFLVYVIGFVIVLGWTEAKADKIDKIIHAIGMVESGNNPKVKDGDNGKAIGQYQIWYVYWKDSGVPGKYEDCRDPEYARKVMRAYWKRYCPEALKSGNAEVLARVHNGGPIGHKKKATVGYWKKVKKHL